MSKSRGISLDYVYEADGVLRTVKSGNAVGFYFGKQGERCDFRGMVTTDLEVAKALQACANKMVFELEQRQEKKNVTKTKNSVDNLSPVKA